MVVRSAIPPNDPLSRRFDPAHHHLCFREKSTRSFRYTRPPTLTQPRIPTINHSHLQLATPSPSSLVFPGSPFPAQFHTATIPARILELLIILSHCRRRRVLPFLSVPLSPSYPPSHFVPLPYHPSLYLSPSIVIPCCHLPVLPRYQFLLFFPRHQSRSYKQKEPVPCAYLQPRPHFSMERERSQVHRGLKAVVAEVSNGDISMRQNCLPPILKVNHARISIQKCIHFRLLSMPLCSS